MIAKSKALLARLRPLLLSFFFFFSLPVLLVFSPHIFNTNNDLFKSGDASFMAFHAFTLRHDFSREFLEASMSVGYPDRYFFTYDSYLTMSVMYLLVLTLTNNSVLAYNILVPLFLAAAGLGAFLFAKKHFALTGPHAFIVGLFYSYNSITLQFYWHAALLSAYAILPFFYSQFLQLLGSKKVSVKNTVLTVLLLTLLGLSSLQIWIFSILISPVVALLWTKKITHQKLLVGVKKVFLVYGISTILLSPILLYHHFFSERYAINRSIEDLVVNSTKLETGNIGELFLPYCRSYARTLVEGNGLSYECNSGERFWLGLTPIIILLAALFAKKRVSLRRYVFADKGIFFLFIFAITIILSMGPLLKIGAEYVPLPFYIPYKLSSVFDSMRVPARFIFFFQLFWAVGLASVIQQISKKEKLKSFSPLFIVLIALLFVFENSYSYHQIGYKHITAFEEPVWRELAKPSYGLFLKYPMPWFGGYNQENPDDTQELWEYMVHLKPTIWAYPGLVSHSSNRLMELYLDEFFVPEKLNILSALGVRTVVIDKTAGNIPFSEISHLPVLYDDVRYSILALPDDIETQASFESITTTCFIETLSPELEKYNKNWLIKVAMTNPTQIPLVQLQPQVKVRYEFDGVDAGDSWFQIPFAIPAGGQGEALLKIKKRSSSQLPHTLYVESRDDSGLRFSCDI